MVKLKHIAEKLGMGISTVSEVLNGKENNYLSKPKKELILETAKEMGYVPNKMSRGIQGLPTNTIGLVGSILSVPITSHLINHLCNAIDENGFSLLLGDSRHEPSREKALINEFLSRGADGLLLDSCLSKDELDKLIKGRIPYVGFNQLSGGINVTMSRKDGVFMAVDHLISKHNCGKIGFMTVSVEEAKGKLKGYRSALTKHGIPMRREYIIDLPDISLEENAAGKIANLDMDAVFCSNDFMAGHLINRLRAQGMRVPQDIAIMGFDGIDSICDLVDPPLTSLRQPVEEIAKLTVNLMMEKLKGAEVEEKTYYVEPTLRIGKSCGC